MRSCVVCSNKADKSELIRLIIVENNLFFDISQKIQARGYYVCYDLNCINKITTKKRRFKESFEFDKKENLVRLKISFIKYILKMLNILYLKKEIIIGVKDIALNKNNIEYIITSSDISLSSFKKLEALNIDNFLKNIDVTKLELGKSVNRAYVVALGIKKIKDLNFKRVLSQYNILFSQE